MARNDFGMSTWDEETGGRKAPQAGDRVKVDFMRLNDGPNLVRIVTKPYKYLVHKYKEESDPGFGDRASCSGPSHNGECPLCARGDKPKQRWYIGVIDRATGQYKVLDIGSGIYADIRDLNRDEAWGDPSKYDVVIKVNKKGSPKDYYSVLPRPSTALTPSDLEHKSDKNEEDLARRCTPPQPEWVLTRINAMREKKGLQPLAAMAAKTGAVKVSVPVAVAMDDSEEVSFPAADE